MSTPLPLSGRLYYPIAGHFDTNVSLEHGTAAVLVRSIDPFTPPPGKVGYKPFLFKFYLGDLKFRFATPTSQAHLLLPLPPPPLPIITSPPSPYYPQAPRYHLWT